MLRSLELVRAACSFLYKASWQERFEVTHPPAFLVSQWLYAAVRMDVRYESASASIAWAWMLTPRSADSYSGRDARGLCLIASGWSWQKFVSCTVTIWPAHSSHERSGAEVIGGNSKGTKTRARTRIHRLPGMLRSKDGHLMRTKASLIPANPKTLIAESDEGSLDPQEFARSLSSPYPEVISVILSLPPGGEAK